MWIALLLSCALDGSGPAPAGTPAADGAAKAGEIATMAAEVDALAHELTSLVDESRRQVADGRSTREAEIAKMRALMAQIDEKNAAIQQAVADIQAEARAAAGDPAPPAEPPKRR